MTSIFVEAPADPRRLPWATLASLMLHGCALVAVAFVLTRQDATLPPPEPPPLAVEIVTPAQFAALQPVDMPPVLATESSATAAVSVDADADEPGVAPATPSPTNIAPDGTITARTLYSGTLMQQPEMQRVRQGLRNFADSERLIQICNVEALEQIRRAAPDVDPDTMVAYAMADLLYNGMTLTARGGAYRSRRKWFNVSFTCTAAPGYEAVAAFQFKLGDPIPEGEWEEHFLNAEDADE